MVNIDEYEALSIEELFNKYSIEFRQKKIEDYMVKDIIESILNRDDFIKWQIEFNLSELMWSIISIKYVDFRTCKYTDFSCIIKIIKYINILKELTQYEYIDYIDDNLCKNIYNKIRNNQVDSIPKYEEDDEFNSDHILNIKYHLNILKDYGNDDEYNSYFKEDSCIWRFY